MGRGTPTAQGSVFQPNSGYGSQQPMASNTRYTGPQRQFRTPSPNDLTFARGPIPLNQQGPAVGGSLARGLGQIPLPQQMGQTGQSLFNLLRGQPVTQQPALTPAVMPQQPASPQLQAAFQAASNQMAGRPDNYVPQGTPAPMPQQPMVNRMPPPVDPNVPYRPTRPDVFNPDGTPATRPRDPDFNINTATNTFFKSLADRVQSGQMSVADAQRAQAEMRALQLNPAAATREAATEIFQRNLQVGRFHPENIAAEQRARERAAQQPTFLTTPPPPSEPRVGISAPPPPIPTPPPTPTPAPTPGMPQGWNVSSAYRDFGSKLGQMVKSGQLTPQQANAIKDPAFQATKLGNTPEAFAAMQKALAGLAGYAAGGYATQVAPEDPRMQAMRYLQRLGK